MYFKYKIEVYIQFSIKFYIKGLIEHKSPIKIGHLFIFNIYKAILNIFKYLKYRFLLIN